MPDEPDNPELGEDAEGDAENERPTVSPPFDPIAFARDILKPSPAPMAAVRPKGDPHTVATPATGTQKQAAHLSRPPPAPASGSSSSQPAHRMTPPGLRGSRRSKTPTSTISLANARIPSNLPPRPGADASADGPGRSAPGGGPRKIESVSSFSALDREWAELEVATRPPPPDEPEPSPPDASTRPPPADGPGEDPVVEILQDRTPQIDLDDVADLMLTPDLDVRPSATLRGDDLDDDAEDEHSADTVRRPILDPQTRAREMADRVSLGDYSGALEIAEQILAESPADPAALECAATCRTVLRQMYATRIGPLDRVPVVMVPRDQLRWLSIDHRAGFVLSLVDGVSTLEMIIDVSGMAELDTLRILSELAQQRIISLR